MNRTQRGQLLVTTPAAKRYEVPLRDGSTWTGTRRELAETYPEWLGQAKEVQLAPAAAALQAKVTASMNAALQGQLMPGQELQTMPCTPIIMANHGVGDEATHVTVSVSDTCTAIAYEMQQLNAKATQLLTTQATQVLGTGYLLSGNVQVNVTKATQTQTTPGLYRKSEGEAMEQRYRAIRVQIPFCIREHEHTVMCQGDRFWEVDALECTGTGLAIQKVWYQPLRWEDYGIVHIASGRCC